MVCWKWALTARARDALPLSGRPVGYPKVVGELLDGDHFS